MEKNVSFQINDIRNLSIKLAWAQLEMYADDVTEIKVMAAGEESTVNDLKIEAHDGTLLVEQPQYGLNMNLTAGKWMEVFIRIPRAWKGSIDAHTISGLLNTRALSGEDIDLETVSGDLRVMAMKASSVELKTVSGSIKAGDIDCAKLSLRAISGSASLQSSRIGQIRATAVSGDEMLEMNEPFERLEVTTVSGDVTVYLPSDVVDATLRAVSGRMHTTGVSVQTHGPVIRVNGVSSDLFIINNQTNA